MIKSEKIVLMSMDIALFVGGKKSRYYEEIGSFETTEGDFMKISLKWCATANHVLALRRDNNFSIT
jgi:hypothetical protein